MPYDPTYPAASTPAKSAPMRAQLQAIVDLIDTIPQGPQGLPGTSVTGAVVDGVSSLNPGEPATASASFANGTVHFSFALPRGNDGTPGGQGLQGIQGIQGIQGEVGPVGPMFTSFNVNSTTTLAPGQPASVQTFFDGASIQFNFAIPRGNDGGPGPTGAIGPAFTSFAVDSVTTLAPSQPATVVATFDGTFVRFAFGIPQGQQGVPGNNGFDGSTGPQGLQGAPGEVTAAQLAGALAGTASNTNPIVTLDLAISDPPTQGELTQVLAKVNELIVGLRR
jgi:hypothetical protein